VIVTASRGRRDGSGAPESAPLSPGASGPHLRKPHPRGIEGLSPRERAVLQAIADGATTDEVAYSFGISRRTVETHRQNILRKSGEHSILRAVVLAIDMGVIE
jgi:DNA-binding NarL/FixJ family response regulator